MMPPDDRRTSAMKAKLLECEKEIYAKLVSYLDNNLLFDRFCRTEYHNKGLKCMKYIEDGWALGSNQTRITKAAAVMKAHEDEGLDDELMII